MQLSGANLLIASQQLNKTAGPQPQPQAQFAQTLAKETGAVADSFAPLAFKQAPASAPMASPAAAPAQNYAQGPARPGSQLDIRI